jgi:hypothetical protein
MPEALETKQSELMSKCLEPKAVKVKEFASSEAEAALDESFRFILEHVEALSRTDEYTKEQIDSFMSILNDVYINRKTNLVFNERFKHLIDYVPMLYNHSLIKSGVVNVKKSSDIFKIYHLKDSYYSK